MSVVRKDWEHWHAQCALALTPPESRERITRFLQALFRARIRKLGLSQWLATRDDGPELAAQCFETWCMLHPRRDGKHYKDWLLQRGDRGTGALQSGVCLLMRRVVQEWCRRERPGSPGLPVNLDLMTSLPSAEILLEGHLLPADEAIFQEWLADWVERTRSHLSPVSAEILRLRHGGVGFHHPEMKQKTGLSRSRCYGIFHELLTQIHAEIQQFFPDESVTVRAELCCSALERLQSEIFLQKKQDKPTFPKCM